MASKRTLDPERWVTEHGDYLYRYAMSKLREEAAAKDAVPETFRAALKGAERFSSRDFETLPWLHRTPLRLHVWLCRCPNYAAFAQQTALFRTLARAFDKRQESERKESNLCLPQEAKDRMIPLLRK